MVTLPVVVIKIVEIFNNSLIVSTNSKQQHQKLGHKQTQALLIAQVTCIKLVRVRVFNLELEYPPVNPHKNKN